MHHHPNLKDILPCCPCCNGAGGIANQDCCSGCDGTGIFYSPPVIDSLSGDSPQAGLWYVRRYPYEFPQGPGSLYLHSDGSWQPSTTGVDGTFPGFFDSQQLAEDALRSIRR